VLEELSVMEQRHQAVLAVVQDGWKVVEVADRLGVSRQGPCTCLDLRIWFCDERASRFDCPTDCSVCECRRRLTAHDRRRLVDELVVGSLG
jgi:hypothetical protein